MSSSLFATEQRPLQAEPPTVKEEFFLQFSGLFADVDDIDRFHKDFDTLPKLMSCKCDFVVSLSLQDFVMKSRDVTYLHQHEASVLVAGMAVKLHSFICLSACLINSGSFWCFCLARDVVLGLLTSFHALTCQVLGTNS